MSLSSVLRDRSVRLPALILVLIAAIIPVYTWHENTSGFLTDDGMYLLMADFFSPWFEGNIYVEFLTMKHARFPPAFPALVGLLGGGSRNMPIAHLTTGFCLVFSAMMLYMWARKDLASSQVALACLSLYILLPETLIYALELRSEFLYLVFVFSVFLVLETGRRLERHEREILCLGAMLISIAILTRTIGIALLPALLIYLFINRVRRKWLYAGIAIALPVAWYTIKAMNGYSNLYVEDVMRYTTSNGFSWKLTWADIPRNAQALFAAWKANLAAGSDTWWLYHVGAAALLAPASIGFVQRIKRHCPDTHYTIAYTLIILVWPHPDHMVRFVYPLMPLGFIYIFSGVTSVVQHCSSSLKHLAHGSVAFIILLLIYPSTISLIDRYNDPVSNHALDDFRHTRDWLQKDDTERRHIEAEIKYNVISLLKRIPRHLKPNDCTYAVHTPLVMLYAHRPAENLRSNLSPEKLNKCKYLFVMNLDTSRKAKYPLNVIDHRHLALVDIEYSSLDEQQAYLFQIHN